MANFFDAVQTRVRTCEGVTLSGVPYVLMAVTVAVTEDFIKAVVVPGNEKKAYMQMVKDCIVSLGSQKGSDIKNVPLLAADVADMVVKLRILSLGKDFKYNHIEFDCSVTVDLAADVATVPYAWATGENRKTYDTYAEMLAENLVQEAVIGGQKINWKLPLMGGAGDPDKGVLASLADARQATFNSFTTNPMTKEKVEHIEKIDWTAPNADIFYLEEFCTAWKKVEGKTDTLMTIKSRDGKKTANLDFLGMPGFFSTALVA